MKADQDELHRLYIIGIHELWSKSGYEYLSCLIPESTDLWDLTGLELCVELSLSLIKDCSIC
jgi:hypothetical protein